MRHLTNLLLFALLSFTPSISLLGQGANLATLINTGGSVSIGDKVFDHFGWSGTATDPSAISITPVGSGTIGDPYGLRIQCGIFQINAGSKSGILTYAAHTTGNYLISDIQQVVNLTGSPAIGGHFDLSVKEELSPSASISPVVALSTVGYNSTNGFDISDPPIEVSDFLVLTNPLQTVWVRKSISLSVTAAGSRITLSEIKQLFNQLYQPPRPTPPSCSITPSSANLCPGESQTFTLSIQDGTAPFSIVWTGPKPVSPNTTSFTVNNADASDVGTYTAHITDFNNETTTCSADLTLKNTPDPKIAITNLVVCEASENNYAWVADAGVGASYLWTVTGGMITAGQGTPNIYWTAGSSTPVTVSVTVTSPEGCPASSSRLVTVAPLPHVSVNSAQICGCGTVILTATHDAGPDATYLWSNGETNQSITVSTSSSVSYSVVVTSTAGCSATASGTIDVTPSVPSFANFPPDATVECPGSTSPAATGSPDPSGTCSGNSVSYSDQSQPGNCQNHTITVITRRWTVQDLCGNSVSKDQTIKVVDTTVPTIAGVGGPSTVECPNTPNFSSPTASDACGTPTLTFNDTTTPGDCPNAKTITRTWTATDACGNQSTASQMITVVDTTAPTIAGVGGPATIECPNTPTFSSPTASDACGTATLTFNDTTMPGDCPNAKNITRTWTATDACAV